MTDFNERKPEEISVIAQGLLGALRRAARDTAERLVAYDEEMERRRMSEDEMRRMESDFIRFKTFWEVREIAEEQVKTHEERQEFVKWLITEQGIEVSEEEE